MLQSAGENPDFKELLPVIALGGLAGLRLEETLRLEWADIWRVPGHVEIKAQKAKTRSRRLVEICPALAAWLQRIVNFPASYFQSAKICFTLILSRCVNRSKFPPVETDCATPFAPITLPRTPTKI